MTKPTSWKFDLCGGHLALDFANTVSSRTTPTPIERITDYETLLSFCQQTGILDGADAKRLGQWAKADADAARKIHARAIELREAMYELFASAARKELPRRSDLATLTAWSRRLELGETFEWGWAAGRDAPDAMLAPIVRAALDLLTAKSGRVHLCAADDCVWLFLDTSKNQSRQWCDMKQCGNRAKARRFYERVRAER